MADKQLGELELLARKTATPANLAAWWYAMIRSGADSAFATSRVFSVNQKVFVQTLGELFLLDALRFDLTQDGEPENRQETAPAYAQAKEAFRRAREGGHDEALIASRWLVIQRALNDGMGVYCGKFDLPAHDATEVDVIANWRLYAEKAAEAAGSYCEADLDQIDALTDALIDAVNAAWGLDYSEALAKVRFVDQAIVDGIDKAEGARTS